MKISVLSHACVLIETCGIKIITDPWFFGTAFNDGWSLDPAPDYEAYSYLLRDVDLVWLSHEHPDHFHIPTLRYLADVLPKSVVIYLQRTNSEKIQRALRKMGYENFSEMRHMYKYELKENLEIAVYCHRQIDSALGIFLDGNLMVLNINDAELNRHDVHLIKAAWGTPRIILNQFALAGSEGLPSKLQLEAKKILNKVRGHHDMLDARFTIPFASFIKFCQPDNAYMNEHISTVDALKRCFQDGEKSLLSLPVGTIGYSLPLDGQSLPGPPAATSYIAPMEFSEAISCLPGVTESDLHHAVVTRVSRLMSQTSPAIRAFLDDLYFFITDYDKYYRLSFSPVSFEEVREKPDHMIVGSQPLKYAFSMPFGIQTLGVSARYRFPDHMSSHPRSWKLLRMLSSLENAGVYLNIRIVCDRQTLFWLWSRRAGLMSQILQQWKRFFRGGA